MFYLTDTHDIRIHTPKWFQVSPNKVFQSFMNLMVILSSLVLAFDDPFAPRSSDRVKILLFLDNTFTMIFLLEALIKIIALGLCKTSLSGKGRKAYLQDYWNVLDLLLVIVQLFDLF